MVDSLLLRLKGALQEPWIMDVPALRRAVISGTVKFAGLRDVISELIPIWTFVRDYVRHTGPRQSKSAAEKVRSVYCFGVHGCPFICVVRGRKERGERKKEEGYRLVCISVYWVFLVVADAEH